MQDRGLSHENALLATRQSFDRAQAEVERTFTAEQDERKREHDSSMQDTKLSVQQLMQTQNLTQEEAQNELDRRQQNAELEVRQLMQTQHLDQEAAEAELDRQQREADREFRTDYQQREIDHQQNITRVQDYEGALDRYATSITGITSNAGLPAAERQRQIEEARNIRDRSVAAIDGIYGTDTEWSATGEETEE